MTRTISFPAQSTANRPNGNTTQRPEVSATRPFIRLADGRAVPTRIVQQVLERIREWRDDGHGARLSTCIRGQFPGLSLDDILYLLVTHDEQSERKYAAVRLGIQNALEIAHEAACDAWSVEAA